MMMSKYYQYTEDVIDGKAVAGELVKKACIRFKNDLKRDDLLFDEKEVAKCIKFFSTLTHWTDAHAQKPFILEPWQEFIVANIIGFKYKSTGFRRFSSSYIEVARKNGKTALAAALALYFLITEKGAQVILAANSKEQAKICFDMAANFTKGIDPKKKYFTPFRANILFPSTKSELKVIAADDSKLDGFNASFAITDEYHAASNSKVRDVIKSSMAMRSQPHLMTITTAGFDKAKPCYQLRETCQDIINGLKEDDETFIAIYTLDDGDDWADDNNWYKSNPNLGVTVQKKFLQSQVLAAKNNSSEEVGILTKNFNLWTNVSNVWISDSHVLKNTKKLSIEDFKDWDCWIGVDLAAVSDLTAVSFMFCKDGHYYFFNHYYLPEIALHEKPDKELYRNWKREGFITITDGNTTDYDYITNDIMKIGQVVNICSISYDKWNSTSWAIQCTELGLPLEPYAQNLSSFNAPTRELERLILSDSVTFDNNPIDRFCFRNVEIKSDWNGNVKPVKNMGGSKSKAGKGKIDGVIAMLMALGKYLTSPHYSGEIMFM